MWCDARRSRQLLYNCVFYSLLLLLVIIGARATGTATTNTHDHDTTGTDDGIDRYLVTPPPNSSVIAPWFDQIPCGRRWIPDELPCHDLIAAIVMATTPHYRHATTSQITVTYGHYRNGALRSPIHTINQSQTMIITGESDPVTGARPVLDMQLNRTDTREWYALQFIGPFNLTLDNLVIIGGHQHELEYGTGQLSLTVPSLIIDGQFVHVPYASLTLHRVTMTGQGSDPLEVRHIEPYGVMLHTINVTRITIHDCELTSAVLRHPHAGQPLPRSVIRFQMPPHDLHGVSPSPRVPSSVTMTHTSITDHELVCSENVLRIEDAVHVHMDGVIVRDNRINHIHRIPYTTWHTGSVMIWHPNRQFWTQTGASIPITAMNRTVTIIACVIRNNTMDIIRGDPVPSSVKQFASGGGMGIYGNNLTVITILDSRFESNRISTPYLTDAATSARWCSFGGALAIAVPEIMLSSLDASGDQPQWDDVPDGVAPVIDIRHTAFLGNEIYHGIRLAGAALYVHQGSLLSLHHTVMMDNDMAVIMASEAMITGGGLASLCMRGGRYSYDAARPLQPWQQCSVDITHATVMNNTIQVLLMTDQLWVYGAGLYLQSRGVFAGVNVTDSCIHDNSIDSGGGIGVHHVAGAGMAIIADLATSLGAPPSSAVSSAANAAMMMMMSASPSSSPPSNDDNPTPPMVLTNHVRLHNCSFIRNVLQSDGLVSHLIGSGLYLGRMNYWSAAPRGCTDHFIITSCVWSHNRIQLGTSTNEQAFASLTQIGGSSLYALVGWHTRIHDTHVDDNAVINSSPTLSTNGAMVITCGVQWSTNGEGCHVQVTASHWYHNLISTCAAALISYNQLTGTAMGAALYLSAMEQWHTITINDTSFIGNLIESGSGDSASFAMCTAGEITRPWAIVHARGAGLAIERSMYFGGSPLPPAWIETVTVNHSSFVNNTIMIRGLAQTAQPGANIITISGAAFHTSVIRVACDTCLFDGNIIAAQMYPAVLVNGGTIASYVNYVIGTTTPAPRDVIHQCTLRDTTITGSRVYVQSERNIVDVYGVDVGIYGVNLRAHHITLDRVRLVRSSGTIIGVGHSYILGCVSVRAIKTVSVNSWSITTRTIIHDTSFVSPSVDSFSTAGGACLVSGYHEQTVGDWMDSTYTAMTRTRFDSATTNANTRELCESTMSIERSRVGFIDLLDTVAFRLSGPLKWVLSEQIRGAINVTHSMFSATTKGPAMAIRPTDVGPEQIAVTVNHTLFEELDFDDARGGSLYVSTVHSLDVHHVVFRRNSALTGAAITLENLVIATMSYLTMYQNLGDGHAFVVGKSRTYLPMTLVLDTATCDIECNPDQIAVMIATSDSAFYSIADSLWQCPLGAPWRWHAFSGGCTSCAPSTYDARIIVPPPSHDHDHDHDDNHQQYRHGVESQGQCITCDPQMTCDGKPNVTVHNGWSSSVRPSSNQDSHAWELVSTLPPPGYGCDRDVECLWWKSCTTGRNVSVPFCGSCISGYSEAYGTAQCIPSSQCGNAQSYFVVITGVILSLLYILFKSSREETPSGGIIDSLLFFAQVVDLVLPITSSSSRFFALFDLQLGSAAAGSSSGVCLYHMDGVDKILSGYYLPVILLLVWAIMGIIRSCVDHIKAKQWHALREQAILQHMVGGDDGGDGHHDDHDHDHMTPPVRKERRICCGGYLVRPTLSLIILHTALFSYSSIVKTTMALLQCRPSPVDNEMIMYSAGAISCYSHWYHILAFFILPITIISPFILVYLARSKRTHAYIRHQLSVVYRVTSPSLRRWGHALQLIRRLLLVIVATFTQIPETRSILLQLFLAIMLFAQPALRPFSSNGANITEVAGLATLLILSSFNVASSARVSGGADPRNTILDVLTLVLLFVPFTVGIAFMIYLRCSSPSSGNDNNGNANHQDQDHHSGNTEHHDDVENHHDDNEHDHDVAHDYYQPLNRNAAGAAAARRGHGHSHRKQPTPSTPARTQLPPSSASSSSSIPVTPAAAGVPVSRGFTTPITMHDDHDHDHHHMHIGPLTPL